MAIDKRKTLFDKFFKDVDGHFALFETPNLLLSIWLSLKVLGFLINIIFHLNFKLLSVLSFGILFAWAWQEAVDGDNYFRRLLGLTVLVFSVISRLHN